ncbi:ABC transporter permease [Spongisporangium articulatum]|uniref:ABC transporter permease n=1 Tax=Spongisporangium articulatum TaxID=3362603 RepID=A0ABW8AI98_9ACTN
MTEPTQPQTPPDVVPHESQTRAALRALVAHKFALVCLVVLGLVLLAALLGRWLVPYDVDATDIPGRLQGPSPSHLFGTDELGRDVFSRVIAASGVSLRVGVIAVGISLVFGVALGLLAGFYGRFVDDAVMRVMDMLFAFPAVLLAMAILAVLGPGVTNAMIAIGIVYLPIFARVTRAGVLAVREEVYVTAARSIGAGDLRIMATHVLPNVTGPIIVQTSLSLAFAILSEAALSFLGLGVQPPAPSWGRMLYDGRDFVEQAWWMGFFPGLAIFLTVLSFNIVGDALRDALDPAQRSAIEARQVGDR